MFSGGIVRQITAFTAAGAEARVVVWSSAQGKGLDDYVVGQAGLDISVQTATLNKLIKRSIDGTDFLQKAHIDTVVAEFGAVAMSEAKRKQLAKEYRRALPGK